MKRLLSAVAMILGLAGFGLNLSAQQDPAPRSQTQPQTNATSQQSARSFEGKIEKSGGKLVLQELSTNTAYQLDDQNKAKHYQGQNVKVTATLDPTTNMLRVVDITPSESR